MYIDDCRHTFEHLAAHVLPAHMGRLREAMVTPWPATLFASPGQGAKALARKLGLGGDFSGCYALIDHHRPIYVGISRGVLSRIRQHMLGRTHFDASLAYRVAQRRRPAKGRRSANMEDAEFRAAFAGAQEYLRTLQVAAVQIENSLELYVFEAYAAMELGTSEWNSFRTH